MADEAKFQYGLSTGWFASSKPNSDSVIVGGVADTDTRWIRVLSHRAAQLLWFNLVHFLYPKRAEQARAYVATAPIRDETLPTVTTHIVLNELDNKYYELEGWVGRVKVWQANMSDKEARRFLKALNAVLYPERVPKRTPPQN